MHATFLDGLKPKRPVGVTLILVSSGPEETECKRFLVSNKSVLRRGLPSITRRIATGTFSIRNNRDAISVF